LAGGLSRGKVKILAVAAPGGAFDMVMLKITITKIHRRRKNGLEPLFRV
jgi:hypothetical protein